MGNPPVTKIVGTDSTAAHVYFFMILWHTIGLFHSTFVAVSEKVRGAERKSVAACNTFRSHCT